MSATVTYKGETLTTATNQTRVLETEGKYLEDDITITDVTGAAPSGTKNISITTNGTTTEDVTSYATASITTAVPASAVDSGTKSISISANGTTTHDVVGYASASVTANVPNSYSAGDEGKVVSSGALVSQTAHADVTPTTSDQTIDTTTNNSVKVKGDADLVAGNIKKDVEIFGVTGSYEGGGGGGASGFDLLEDITISQAVRSYQIDFQNTWYSYDRILLYISGQFVGGSDWLYWNVNATSLDSGRYSGNASSFDFMCEVISVPLSGNATKVDILAMGSSNHYVLNTNSNLTSMDDVSYFWFSGYSKNLAIGTKIKVYGVKYADL